MEQMTMTRKHYVMLAAALKARAAHKPTDPTYSEGWHAAVSACAHSIAEALAADNVAFDKSRFLKASGVN
jgi:ABC-type sulfate transport system substrate-binding protein